MYFTFWESEPAQESQQVQVTHWSYLAENPDPGFLQEKKYLGIFFPCKILFKDQACQELMFISYRENNMITILAAEILHQ